MGQIGQGGSFQQPFQPKRESPASGNSTSETHSTGANPANESQGSSQTSLNLNQAVQNLGQLLLTPLAGQSARLSAIELSRLLKNLLHLPSELQQLLADVLMMDGPESKQTLQQLLQEAPDLLLSLGDLQKYLGNKIDKNNQKLLQMLQSSNQSLSEGSQNMGEMLSTMSELSTQVKQSPVQALNTTLLLYLPWYPLAAQQRLTLHFEASGKDTEEKSEKNQSSEDDAHLVMLLDTNHLGRFKIMTLPLPLQQLMFHIEHDVAVKNHIPSIQHQVTQSLSAVNMRLPEFEWKQRGISKHLFDDSMKALSKASVSHDAEERKNRQSVVVHNVGQVPVTVVQGAYWFVRVILELDNQVMESAA